MQRPDNKQNSKLTACGRCTQRPYKRLKDLGPKADVKSIEIKVENGKVKTVSDVGTLRAASGQQAE